MKKLITLGHLLLALAGVSACTDNVREDPLDETADLDTDVEDGDALPPDAIETDELEPLDCWARSLESCADEDCEVFDAYPYVDALSCHDPDPDPAFCKPIRDVLCTWEGDPVILTTPTGASWYVGWSCFTPPPDWTATYVPEGRDACVVERDCLDYPIDECEAAGCTLFEAYPAGQGATCFEEPAEEAFCARSNDIDCDWEGPPLLLTEPSGQSWYVGWSCFTSPEGWQRTEVPEGLEACPRDCLDYGVDDCEAAGCTLFEAYPYDAAGVCYDEPARPAFCQLNVDIDCTWEGMPVILTEPEGQQWYVGWSCFTSPDDWSRQELSDELTPCSLSCIELSVEDCVAAGCELMPAHPYDGAQACFEAEELPAFCRANNDIICGWEGDPVILTEPSGAQWYIDWSCFTTPASWTSELVPGGAAACP